MKRFTLFVFLLAFHLAKSQSALITPNSGGNGNFLFKSTGANYGQFSTTSAGANLVFRVNEPASSIGNTGLITGAIYSDATRTVLAGYTDSGQLYGINKVEIGTNSVSNRMVMTNIGRVGIGTDSPSSKFEILDEGLNDFRISSKSLMNQFITLPSSARLSFIYEKGSTDEWRPGYIQANNSGDFTGRLDFFTNGTGTGNKLGATRAMSITNGNVGVGTTTPLTKMDVNGPILTRNRVVFSNQNGNDPSSNPVWVIDNYNDDFRLFQQPTLTGVGDVQMTIQNGTGNVGIGTSPNNLYKLSINGTARSKEVIVETGWADYVFDDKYKLSSLSEVESYIKENKHLPDVPSAKDIQEKGAFVGELMTKMMQKIEELTLYSIEQDKKIGQLQQDLIELKNRK